MRHTRILSTIAPVILLMAPLQGSAQDASALLDLLVKKKLITEQEARSVRSELATHKPLQPTPGANTVYKEVAAPVEKTAAEKWKLSTPITELELSGDVRVRYEYRGGRTDENDPAHPNDWQERDRERYRVRLALRGIVLDDWFFGVRLETSQSERSGNVTFGDDTSGSSSASNNGPFSKASDGINVGQAYIGYKGIPDVTLTGGHMPNPLVTSVMVWDPDISPEGLSEQWKHTFAIGGGDVATSSDKDGKQVVPKPSEPWLKIDLFANFAQFIYDDANPENPIGARGTTTQPGVRTKQKTPNTDAFLLAWQVGSRFNFPNHVYAQIAPTLYNYSGNGDTFNVHFQGDTGTTNETGINSLLVFDVPMEFGWKLGSLPMRIFGEFADNLEADNRAAAAGHPDKGDERYAYNVGIGVGQLKHKHDWELDVWWQHTEQYALDPNLVDDDLFDARTNMQGIVAKAGYMLSDAVSVNLTYAYGWRINQSLGTGGSGGAIGINPLDEYQLFQADLNLKF